MRQAPSAEIEFISCIKSQGRLGSLVPARPQVEFLCLYRITRAFFGTVVLCCFLGGEIRSDRVTEKQGSCLHFSDWLDGI